MESRGAGLNSFTLSVYVCVHACMCVRACVCCLIHLQAGRRTRRPNLGLALHYFVLHCVFSLLFFFVMLCLVGDGTETVQVTPLRRTLVSSP